MLIFSSKNEIKGQIIAQKANNNSIGFVPTMGALHLGHLSLIAKSKEENDITVVSIFVNPTQFNNPSDLEKYPSNTQKDIDLLEKANVDILFLPSVEEIYGEDVSAKKYDFGNLDKVMEGEHRIGHFDGVATIVSMLFSITGADRAYFGEKDFQQLQIVKKLVEIENIPVDIVPCPIVREDDGLAMSSRNLRLSEEHRREAPFIYNTLIEAKNLSNNLNYNLLSNFVKEKFEENPLFDLEYFEIRDEENLKKVDELETTKKYRAFIAVFADNIRLIDNISLF